MRATELNSSNSKERKKIFSLPKYDQNIMSEYQKNELKKEFKERKEKNLSPLKIKNSYINGGDNRHFVPRKRNFKEMFISNDEDNDIINEPKEKISFNEVNFNPNNESTSTYINSFYNEPSLIKKIKHDENFRRVPDVTNNEINFENVSKEKIKNDDINIDNILIKNKDTKEKERRKEKAEKKKLEELKLINEYSNIIERVLKEEQILFLDDNYHITQVSTCELIPEESSSYIISKRVNFPKEIYQAFPSLVTNDEKNNEDQNENENNDNSSSLPTPNFTVVYPPLNCIIFVKKNILTFFNYISENKFEYLDLPKPVSKILITIPKPGMFINEIKFIMVCVMEGEIDLLTLAFRNNEDDLPIIHKTDFIYSFNEKIIDVISTSNHRIFFSTLNNKIYELNYSVKENNYLTFFSSKNTLSAKNVASSSFFGFLTDLKFIFKKSIEVINKLKVDDTRKILYAVKYTIPKEDTEVNFDTAIDSSIIIFDLGIDGKGFNKIMEINQEDLGDYGFEFNNNFNGDYPYEENDINENNERIRKNNIIIDIAPLTRDKYKEYQLLVIKRNGNKIFLRFNTYYDDSFIKNQDNILSFNNSAFCRERFIDRYITNIKQIPNSNNLDKINFNILYDMICYFPFSTFCYYKIMNENSEKYILNVIEDNLSTIAKKENIKLMNKFDDLKENEEIIFESSTGNKKIFSIIKLSDYNLEDVCDLGNLLKYSSNGFYISDNTKYIDDTMSEVMTYNCMDEYSRQLFYSPEEIGILFSDEFVIFKKLRPIDKLIEILQNKTVFNNFSEIIVNYKNNLSSDSSESNNIKSFMSKSNTLNNPLQINRKSILYQEFKKFVNIHGLIETSVMLMNIITNSNFYYYIKSGSINVNDLNYENNLRINDLKQYKLNPNNLIKMKNENQLMNLGIEYLFNLFKCAEDNINYLINNYQILLQNLIREGKAQSLNNNIINNLKFKYNSKNNNNINIINTNILFESKNFLSYGFALFLSRIMRLFWEEKFFIKKKLYYQEDNFEFIIANNLNQNQIMFIRNILIKFINTLNQYKMEFLQNASDIDTKSNKLKNYLNDIELFLENNAKYTINEIKKNLSKEDIYILKEHKKTLNYFISIYNFAKFSKDFDIIIGMANRAIELLNLLDNIYKINIAKEIQKRKKYNMLNIKIKDLYKNNYPFILNELLQIIYEYYFKEKSMDFATIKLQEIIQQSPNIVNINSATAIEGNFLLKFCNYYQMDDIDKISYIKEALEKINLSLNSIKIEKVVNYLSKFNQVENIIKLCLKKGKLLQPEINLNIENNINNQDKLLFNENNNNNNENNNKDINHIETDMNKIQEENNVTEFYKCINIILNILNYLHNSIIYNSFENYIDIVYPRTSEFSYPIYIKNILSNKNVNEYIVMEKKILNLIFDEEYNYIHDTIVNFLKENNMMNKLQEINSTSIEKYLNNQININDNSPQSLFSMFNYYYKNKNYSSATKILATLINYDNSLNNNGNNTNRVTLDDRITYVNTMLNTLNLQIKDAEYNQNQELKINEINEAKSLKEKMINIRNILNIQNEIKNYLIAYINNVTNEKKMNDNDLDEFKDAVLILDNKTFDLNTLYNSYAKNFSIFDCCMSIFFQLKFSSTNKNININSKIDPKEVKNIYCDYICKLDPGTLQFNWPQINFERFNRIFNILIKEKTQYQNFYDMLSNNGMKNKFKDIIPLEFIIAIIESMNRNLIFNDKEFDEGDNYIMKTKQSFNQSKNPFWFILYLKQQVYLPISYIFNEYYIIYLSITKDANIKKYNINPNMSSSNLNNNINDNISVNTFNSLYNNSSNIFEEYGMVFDGNLSGDLNKPMSQDNKLYIIFLLLAIAKIWIDRVIDFIDNNNDMIGFNLSNNNNKQIKQSEFDLKQFNLEIKKNGNQKIKLLIKEFFDELQKCNMKFSPQKFTCLKKYFGEIIEGDLIETEKKVNKYFDDYNNFAFSSSNNNEQNKILKVNVIENKNNNEFDNSIFNRGKNQVNNNFINLMGKYGN